MIVQQLLNISMDTLCLIFDSISKWISLVIIIMIIYHPMIVIVAIVSRDSDYAALQDFSQLMRDLRLGESKEHI